MMRKPVIHAISLLRLSAFLYSGAGGGKQSTPLAKPAAHLANCSTCHVDAALPCAVIPMSADSILTKTLHRWNPEYDLFPKLVRASTVEVLKRMALGL